MVLECLQGSAIPFGPFPARGFFFIFIFTTNLFIRHVPIFLLFVWQVRA